MFVCCLSRVPCVPRVTRERGLGLRLGLLRRRTGLKARVSFQMQSVLRSVVQRPAQRVLAQPSSSLARTTSMTAITAALLICSRTNAARAAWVDRHANRESQISNCQDLGLLSTRPLSSHWPLREPVMLILRSACHSSKANRPKRRCCFIR